MDSLNKQNSLTHFIVGASRGIGRSLVDQSIRNGHSVTALARTSPTEPITGCNWITGNATEPEAFLDQLPETINALTFLSLIHI